MNGEATLLFNKSRSVYINNCAPKGYISYLTDSGTMVNESGDPEGFPIYKMHPEKQIYYKTHTVLSKKKAVVRDTLGAIPWEIFPEFKQFGPYSCQKAIGAFRGRTYEVWFAPDIPIPSGPYKLGGLPGLILEAQSIDGFVKFLFVKLEFSQATGSFIVPPHGKYLGLNYYELQIAEDEQSLQYEKEAKARGNEMTISRDPGAIEIGN
ncbi:MAG TPA: GLPGLI family protein [Saprospiraceae bacterium]|nr:GLPGLI family protein [Saprospiraceae bacterium]HNM25101.1 GLPGLI family protein [Saprospiraceae bacterium]